MIDGIMSSKDVEEMRSSTMNYERWYWILREHIGEDAWVDIYEAHNVVDEK